MKRRYMAGGLLLVTSLLALACDARTTEPDAKAEREAQPSADIPAEAGEAATATPTRDLGQLERELASNEAKLRQLGVTIAAIPTDGEGELAQPAEEVEKQEKKASNKPAPAPDGGGRSKDRKPGKAGGSKKSKADEDATISGSAPSSGQAGTAFGGGSGSKAVPGGDATPDPAKSVQSPPADRPTEQAEERCPLICSLADSTCELTDEICELADRHTDDDAYSLACERASTDCKQAREACLECLG